jgi:hypothetical protein
MDPKSKIRAGQPWVEPGDDIEGNARALQGCRRRA